jgi:hypothetical protein
MFKSALEAVEVSSLDARASSPRARKAAIAFGGILWIAAGLAGCGMIPKPTQLESIAVAVTPASASVPTSQSLQLFALVKNDGHNLGVKWSLIQSGASCSPGCGTIVGFTSDSVIYAAPSGVPNSALVTINAVSLADNTRSASSTITIASTSPVGGSSQWIDITKYGARSVTYAPTASANCIAGSNVVTLSNGNGDFTQFENGDSIRLDSCGSPTAMTPPTGVGVLPGMNAGGTPAVPVQSLGTTSYSYQVIACDKSGGCSAASAPSSTTTGPAALGRITTQIKSMSLSNNSMTVTTATAHGFVNHALVYIQYFSTHTASFEGWYIVSSVPSATTFTFLTSIDSRIGGTPTLDTSGGTVVAFNCNVVSWTAVTDAWKYFIYGRNSGAVGIVGVAEPGTTSWQDYGSTMMGNFSFPSFVPLAPPTSALNQYLLTTISSGGGSNSIVVAAPVQNSISNVMALMGSDAAIQAAFQAAKYGTLSIPEGSYHVAGYLDLHTLGPIYVVQAGTLATADTIQIPGGMYWKGVGPNSSTAFQEVSTPYITGMGGSYPTMYLSNAGSVQFDHVTLNSYAGNGILLFYADTVAPYTNPPTGLNFDYTTFAAGGGNNTGYMNRQIIMRTGGFDYNFSKCLFSADQEPNGNEGDIGYTFLPSVLFVPFGATPTASLHFKDSWWVGKSAVELNQSTPGATGGVSDNVFNNAQTQNDPLPLFIASNFPNVNTWSNAYVSFDGFSPADFPSAMTGNWAANILTVNLVNLSNLPQGNHSLLVGNPTTFVGQSGGTASSGSSGGGWLAAGGSQVGYLLPPPAVAPLLTLGSGGNVTPGSYSYEITWIDAFGNSTTPGPSATINVVPGMQAVTVTPQSAPAGAMGWQYYRNGALTGPSSGSCGPFVIGTSQTDRLPFVACANSAPSQNNAMSSGQGINGVETTQIELTGGAHKTVISGIFTADRTLTVQDASGASSVTIAKGTVVMPTDAIAAGVCGAVVSAAANNVIPGDVIHFSSSVPPQANSLNPRPEYWPTANNVNFQYCNRTNASITPDAATLNWQVIR